MTNNNPTKKKQKQKAKKISEKEGLLED